jgi:hypothetical protein
MPVARRDTLMRFRKAAVIALVIAAVAAVAVELVGAQTEQVNLVPFIAVAAIVAAAVAVVIARRFWWLSAIMTVVLVPALDYIYQIALLLLCFVTGCDDLS